MADARARFWELCERVTLHDEAHFQSSINHAYLDTVWEYSGRYNFYRHEVADQGAKPDPTT